MTQIVTCDACGKCCLPCVTVSVSDILRIMNHLEEDANNWTDFFNLLIDENGFWYHSVVLEIKADRNRNCIFFDSNTKLCKIHSFKPWKCMRYYCAKFRKEPSYEEFYEKHGNVDFIREDQKRESQYNTQTIILKEAITIFKRSKNIDEVKEYLTKGIIKELGIKLQKEQRDMFIRIMLAYSKRN